MLPRHQPHAIDSHTLDNVDHLGDFREVEILFAAYEDNTIDSGSEYLQQSYLDRVTFPCLNPHQFDTGQGWKVPACRDRGS